MPTHVLDRDEAIDLLRRKAAALRARGVLHLALIGSVARGESRPDSDIDLLIDVDPARPFSLLDHSELCLFLSDLLGRDTDVLVRDTLDARALSHAQQDEAIVF